jgi:ubiquinone/menaquinone biosynthesis C-methylase UbiE
LAEDCRNFTNSSYSRHDWLDNHHAIKSRMRSELIGKLPLIAGDRILDFGCGTGNWAILAAERVGLHGEVLGIDCDRDTLEHAEQRRVTHPLKEAIRFELADITTCELDLGIYDGIFLFNVLSYLRSAEDVVKRVCDSMKRTGRLYIKDSDLQSDFFWPVPYDLYSALVSAVTSSADRSIPGNYNPFYAREIPGMLSAIANIRVVTLSQSYSLLGSMLPQEREYVRANATMLAAAADRNGASEAAAKWLDLFAEGKGCILDNPAFIYTMTEFIFQISFI